VTTHTGLHTTGWVGVVILNYNGWSDTIECLESLLRLSTPRITVVVCDNGSTDESLKQIRHWAAGRVHAPTSPFLEIARCTQPPVPKPVHLVEMRPEQLSGLAAAALPPQTVLLVQNGQNLGFAAGNNPALGWFASDPSISHAWVLNNDTVVTPSALSAMVRRLGERPDAGLCGSRLLHYHAPGSVQALGGLRYNRWLGSASAITMTSPASDRDVERVVEQAMDMVHGASVLVSRQFLRGVGPLAEDYFLYSEEIDWAERGRRAGFSLAYAHDAIVYHKEGAAIGTSGDPYRRSWVSDFYAVRSRLRVAAKFYPATLPGVYLGLGAVVLNRLRRGQFDRAIMVLRVALSPASYRPHRGDTPPHLDRSWR